jgi:autotransporter-associated beta strand protein
MTTASFNGREYGHTGQGFSFLWGAMGANMGGALAVAEYLKPVRWHLDLERRTDGSFVYDGQEQYGAGTTADGTYLGASGYYDLNPTASYILTYSLPLQRLYITGKNAIPANTLDAAKVTKAIAAATFKQDSPGFTITQLIAALSDFDPVVRNYAAIELGKRTLGSADLTTLRGMVTGTNANGRMGACQALGLLKDATALPLIAQRLDKNIETNSWVRAKAASAIRSYTPATASAQLTPMLTNFVANATDPDVIVWDDPIQIANNYLSFALFGDAVYGGNNVATYTISASKSLLYPAVKTGLKQPDSISRTGAAKFCYDRLPLTDVQALPLDLFEVAEIECQADRMWSADARASGIKTLAKHKTAEAIPLAIAMLEIPKGFEWGSDTTLIAGLDALAVYGDAARWTLPALRGYLGKWSPTSSQYTKLVSTIASIEAATTSPTGMTNVLPVANPQVVVTTNAKPIILTGFSCRTNAVAFANVTAPAHGTLTGTAPNLTYTPTGGYVGLDRFTFQVRDSLTNSAPATVSLIVGMPAGTGLKGEYYDNMDFTGFKFTRTDPQIAFDWGTGSPSNSMAADTFSVRWSGLLLVPETGTYTFSTLNSDGVRLYLNGVPVIDDYVVQTTHWKDGAPVNLTAGQWVDLQMEYFENAGAAVAKLKWTGPSFAGDNGVIIAKQWLFDGTGVANRTPYAHAQILTLVQNTAQAFTLTGSGGTLTYSVITQPAHGTLTGTAPNLTYTPATNFNGSDSFTFVVNNGLSNSAPATVSIAVWAGAPVSYTWKSAASGYWSVATNWLSTVPAAAGEAFYTLNFTPSGTYSVTNDLSNGFVLNQLNVAGAVTFAGTNSLAPTANGPVQPQINQNSTSTVMFNAPLALSAMTVVGGTAGGPVTIPSLISGAGGLVKSSPGLLTIHGISANTYSGGTVINGGTLHWGTITNGISPPCNFALGTGPVTLNSGTLEFDRVTATNALISNGGTIISGNGWGATWNGPVTLNTNTTTDTEWNMTFGGTINGAGGFTKTGDKTLTFSGTNNSTGANFVTSGTLSCSKSAALGAGPLSISDGAIVNLNYTGTRTIAALTLGGTNQPAGTYGSTSSPAARKNAHFTGTGTVTVMPIITLTNTPATGLTSTSATLKATLACAGTNAAVYAHWNTAPGGTNAALWTNSLYVGSWTNVAATNLSLPVFGLSPQTQYYFTFRGTNLAGNVWATNVQSFATLAPVLPTPVLPVSGVTVSNGVPSFSFTAAKGCMYRLDYKNLLTDANWSYGAWSTNTTGGDLPMTLTDAMAAHQSHRFYRLEAAYP